MWLRALITSYHDLVQGLPSRAIGLAGAAALLLLGSRWPHWPGGSPGSSPGGWFAASLAPGAGPADTMYLRRIRGPTTSAGWSSGS